MQTEMQALLLFLSWQREREGAYSGLTHESAPIENVHSGAGVLDRRDIRVDDLDFERQSHIHHSIRNHRLCGPVQFKPTYVDRHNLKYGVPRSDLPQRPSRTPDTNCPHCPQECHHPNPPKLFQTLNYESKSLSVPIQSLATQSPLDDLPRPLFWSCFTNPIKCHPAHKPWRWYVSEGWCLRSRYRWSFFNKIGRCKNFRVDWWSRIFVLRKCDENASEWNAWNRSRRRVLVVEDLREESERGFLRRWSSQVSRPAGRWRVACSGHVAFWELHACEA